MDCHSPGKIIEDHINNIQKILETQLKRSPEQKYLCALYDFTKYTKFSSIAVGLIDIALSQRWDDGFEDEIKLRFLRQEKLSWMGAYQGGVEEIEKIQIRPRSGENQQNEHSKVLKLAKCGQRLGDMSFRQLLDDYQPSQIPIWHLQEVIWLLKIYFECNQCPQGFEDTVQSQTVHLSSQIEI